MIKHLCIAALRNFQRHAAFSFINLIGFSFSMSLGLLILMIIKSQYSFDNFHPAPERTFRINTEALRVSGGSEHYATVPLAVVHALEQEYTLADEVVKIHRRLQGELRHEAATLTLRGIFTDASFLRVFNFPLAKGNADEALVRPNTMVLTSETAKRLFGDRNPIGEEVVFNNALGAYLVTGVLEPFPGNSHLEFEALASFASVPGLVTSGALTPVVDDFNNYYDGYAYVTVKDGVTKEQVDAALARLTASHYKNLQLETRDKGYRFYLQPLGEITPGPALSNNMGRGMPAVMLQVLASLALVVLLMACLNYGQLTVAKSLSRAREIGIRKITGANRAQVFVQFITESVLFCLLAVLLSYLLLQWLIPGFASLHLSSEFSVDFTQDLETIVYFIGFAICSGLVAGILPALYLSAFKPLSVIKNAGDLRIFSRLRLRKGLMVFQFALSLVFILVVLVIQQQMRYLTVHDYGINQHDVVNIPLNTVNFDQLKTAVDGLSEVVMAGGVSHRLGTWEDRSSDYATSPASERFTMRDFFVDENYLDIIEAPFVAGKNFDPIEGDATHQVILNKQALPLFGFSDARDALGQAIYEGDSTLLQVVGVVDDFNFRPLSYAIGPVAFRYDKAQLAIMAVRISASPPKAVAALEAQWRKFDPSHPMAWSMMADDIDHAYTRAGFSDFLTILGYIAFLAISIACLGMLGMAMYATQTRVKEISIRKVMGATSAEMIVLLSRSFLYVMAGATVVAVPAGWWLGQMYLSSFAFRTQPGPGLYLLGIAVATLLGIVTIGTQTYRAARMNPAHAIRNE